MNVIPQWIPTIAEMRGEPARAEQESDEVEQEEDR